jgi:hypothetical protein
MLQRFICQEMSSTDVGDLRMTQAPPGAAIIRARSKQDLFLLQYPI